MCAFWAGDAGPMIERGRLSDLFAPIGPRATGSRPDTMLGAGLSLQWRRSVVDYVVVLQ